MKHNWISSLGMGFFALLILAFANQPSWATSSSVAPNSVSAGNGVFHLAQTLRQRGGRIKSTCQSTDRSESCTCGGTCIAYETNCRCFGALPHNEGNKPKSRRLKLKN